MICVDIEHLLKQEMGLDAASIGSSAVEQAVNARLSACKIGAVHDYVKFVRNSAVELQALIEAVIVPETWFFRDREAFAELARIANERWLPAHAEETFQLLSLPCSSGEEPYSMAMALLDTSFPAERCHIDAVDINSHGLMHAQRAIYGKNSFRGAEFAFRDRYFEVTAQGSRLSDEVRRHVHFQQGNLFADDFLPGAGIYDVIFCRNLLIYFDRTSQDRAIKVLQRLLAANGVLFVGPSESGLLLDHGFIPSKVPMTFSFRRGGPPPQTMLHPPVQAKSAPAGDAHRAAPARVKSGTAQPIRAMPAAVRGTTLEEALKLADQGRMIEAEELCEAHSRSQGPSVQTFFLMGLIRAAAGHSKEAEQYYRKALYLDQNHQDSLVHLGLLLEQQGDAAGARVLRDRVRRLAQKRTVT